MKVHVWRADAGQPWRRNRIPKKLASSNLMDTNTISNIWTISYSPRTTFLISYSMKWKCSFPSGIPCSSPTSSSTVQSRFLKHPPRKFRHRIYIALSVSKCQQPCQTLSQWLSAEPVPFSLIGSLPEDSSCEGRVTTPQVAKPNISRASWERSKRLRLHDFFSSSRAKKKSNFVFAFTCSSR